MANALPPTPLKTPIAGSDGMVSTGWAAFFKESFIRMGGTSGSSNSQLLALIENLQTDNAALVLRLAALEQGRVA